MTRLLTIIIDVKCTSRILSINGPMHDQASWGYVVVGPSALLYSTDATYRAEWVQPVVDWTVEHINSGSLSASLHPEIKVDATQLYLSAHRLVMSSIFTLS